MLHAACMTATTVIKLRSAMPYGTLACGSITCS
jgi:hypothetical protein